MSPSTHYGSLIGRKEERTDFPATPFDGQEFYHTTRHIWYRYRSSVAKWFGINFTTSTSTSTSTTTTSTSSSTTTTSTSTTTTSTSTTTTSTSTTTTSTSTTTSL